MNVSCKICASSSEPLFEATILKRHSVRYYRCRKCEFVQTEEPHWLADAYREPINATDTGYVDRNIECARLTKAVIALLANSSGRFVDYGGGYGLFVRMPNLFARGFEAPAKDERSYQLLTAFEVFEHLPNPREELERMHGLSDNILFSTVLAPPDKSALARWDYLGLEHGQHVSFYTFKTLQHLASDFGLSVCSNFCHVHLFSRKPISPRLFRWVTSAPGSRLISALFRRPSLRDTDYRAVKVMLLGE